MTLTRSLALLFAMTIGGTAQADSFNGIALNGTIGGNNQGSSHILEINGYTCNMLNSNYGNFPGGKATGCNYVLTGGMGEYGVANFEYTAEPGCTMICSPSNRTFTSTAKPVEIVQELQSTGFAAFEINFELDSADLTSEARSLVGILARAMRDPALARSAFEVQGHTDSRGTDSYNQTLSEQRAASVVSELVDIHTIPRSALISKGFGESRLRNTGNPKAAENRRVEVHLIQ